ncbi:MAG: OB-fold nucleic acid binding domain-containing protein, partial [Natronospirillum sp.]
EALIKSGAMDNLGPNRATLMRAMPDAIKAAEQANDNVAAGMMDLFGETSLTTAETDPYDGYSDVLDWPIKVRLAGEKDTLGLYLTGHPIDEYEEEVNRIVSCRLSGVSPRKETQVLAGLIIDVRRMKTKAGKDLMFVTLDDRTARVEFSLFGDQDPNWLELAVVGRVIFIEAEVSWNEYRDENRVRVNDLVDVRQAREKFAKALVVRWRTNAEQADRQSLTWVKALQQALAVAHTPATPFATEADQPKGIPMHIAYCNGQASGEIRLGAAYRAPMQDDFIYRLKELFGPEAVELRF